jgi:hypothetical protein
VQERVQKALGFFRYTFFFAFFFWFLTFGCEYYFPRLKLTEFLLMYYSRLIEIFAWFWVIFILFGFIQLADWILPVFQKSPKFQEFLNRLQNQKIGVLIRKRNAVLSIILLTFASVNYYLFATQKAYAWNRYQNNAQTEVVLWAANYFYDNPLEEPHTIFVEKVERDWLYILLYDRYLEVKWITEPMIANYSSFLSFFNASACYAIISSAQMQSLTGDYVEDFTVHYANAEYIFIEYKVLV